MVVGLEVMDTSQNRKLRLEGRKKNSMSVVEYWSSVLDWEESQLLPLPGPGLTQFVSFVLVHYCRLLKNY